MPEETEENNELSPERRARVIARFQLGQAYRHAARLRDQADALEADAVM